jgi:hypothetical protein
MKQTKQVYAGCKLPIDAYKAFRILAAQKDTSVSQLLRSLALKSIGYKEAAQ